MSKYVIFDLDNTLVDSNHLKPLRDGRRWQDVYRQIPTVALFPGIRESWAALRAAQTYLAIVTHSPRPYATKVLAHVQLEPDRLIAFHDLRGLKKPNPYGYTAARPADDAVGCAVGDDANDLLAADRLPCAAIVAGWARLPLDERSSRERGWHYARVPNDIFTVVTSLE